MFIYVMSVYKQMKLKNLLDRC